jgi:hypothetical protein
MICCILEAHESRNGLKILVVRYRFLNIFTFSSSSVLGISLLTSLSVENPFGTTNFMVFTP